MKSITHENRKRFTITTIISVLVVAILTTTLVLLLKKDTTAPTNTIEVGKRIDTTLGGGRKLLNASVWDGSVATGFGGGTGTEADPYLITSANELAYFRDQVNSGISFAGQYIKQTSDIDLVGDEVAFDNEHLVESYVESSYYDGEYYEGDSWGAIPTTFTGNQIKKYTVLSSTIEEDDEGNYFSDCDVRVDVYAGRYWVGISNDTDTGVLSDYSFAGTYDGNNHVIANILFKDSLKKINDSYQKMGLFYQTNGACIKNLSLQNISLSSHAAKSYKYIAGLVCEARDTTIYNVSIDNFTINLDWTHEIYVGGMAVNMTETHEVENVSVSNFNITLNKGAVGGVIYETRSASHINNLQLTNATITIKTNLESVGGVVAYINSTTISNCISKDVTISVSGSGDGLQYIGGISGYGGHADFVSCTSYADITGVEYDAYVGGVVGYAAGAIIRCAYFGEISIRVDIIGGICGEFQGNATVIEQNLFAGNINRGGSYLYLRAGGLIGRAIHPTNTTVSSTIVSNNLIQGGMYMSINDFSDTFAGLIGEDLMCGVVQNNIVNCVISGKDSVSDGSIGGYGSSTDYGSGGICGSRGGSKVSGDINYYNNDAVTLERTSSGALDKFHYTAGKKTDAEIKDYTSYSAWADFDTYWIIDENLNNGYPFLRAHINYAQVTGFEGSGTEADPYQIKTTADLQGMQAYYNDYDMIDEYWWKLMNDIDISVDANDLAINWCPIGYEGGVASGFNGHLDGNGKTISGLTITAQYENVGLFGRLSSDATITNLNVSGTIAWDQAKYVGGVVGLMEDGATITNCSYTGTITGYLNSGNIAVVGGLAGKYSADAITGIANYDCYVYGTDNYTTFNRFNSTYAIA